MVTNMLIKNQEGSLAVLRIFILMLSILTLLTCTEHSAKTYKVEIPSPLFDEDYLPALLSSVLSVINHQVNLTELKAFNLSGEHHE
jgi:hypothetical protein